MIGALYEFTFTLPGLRYFDITLESLVRPGDGNGMGSWVLNGSWYAGTGHGSLKRSVFYPNSRSLGGRGIDFAGGKFNVQICVSAKFFFLGGGFRDLERANLP